MKKKLKNRLICTGLASLLSSTVHADTIGLYLGAQIWQSNASGLFGELNQQINFNLKDKQQGVYYIAIEHPLPFIPNLKVSSTTLDTKGSTTLAADFNFGNITYPKDSTAATNFNLSYIDYTFYYEVFDSDLLTFDFGLTVRDINADISVATVPASTVNSKVSASAYMPMLYVSTIIGLPFTGFNLFADGDLVSFNGQTMFDYQVGVSYELVDNLAVDVNLTLGYKALKLELDNIDTLYSNLDFSGVFAGAIVHF